MKTMSYEYIKEIKDDMKNIAASLKQVQEAEKAMATAQCNSDYEKAHNLSQNANIDLMNYVKDIVRLASAMGCIADLYDCHTMHVVEEFDVREIGIKIHK